MKSALAGLDFEAQDALLSPVGGPVQRKGGGGTAGIHEAAAHGLSAGGGAMPHAKEIQASFGAHDVSGVKAHVGGKAKEGASAMGATAYASDGQVAFQGAPDLHTAAHEAAHVVQQRQGVSLSGGVGKTGDTYERQADAVADAVVAGKSAEGLLGGGAGGGSGAVQQRSVQQKADVVQMEGGKEGEGGPANAKSLAQEILSAVQADYKKSPIRVAYEQEVAALKEEATKLMAGLDQSKDEELAEVAKKMNARRLEIGKKYKALTILPLRDYILFANSQRYDTEYGPSYEFLRNKGKTNLQVIEGSSRPNPDINAFLAPFGQWLESQPLTTLQSYKSAVGK